MPNFLTLGWPEMGQPVTRVMSLLESWVLTDMQRQNILQQVKYLLFVMLYDMISM